MNNKKLLIDKINEKKWWRYEECECNDGPNFELNVPLEEEEEASNLLLSLGYEILARYSYLKRTTYSLIA